MKAEVLEEVKKEVEKMLDAGFISPCRYAEWISSVVPVQKKDGRWCVCVDFRDINRATPKDKYSMPVAETLINAAAGNIKRLGVSATHFILGQAYPSLDGSAGPAHETFLPSHHTRAGPPDQLATTHHATRERPVTPSKSLASSSGAPSPSGRRRLILLFPTPPPPAPYPRRTPEPVQMATAATASATAATRFTLLAGAGLRSRASRLPTAVRFQRQRGLTTTALLKTADLRPKEQGQPETLDYRVFLVDGGGRKVSPWHDVPLRAGDGAFHFIVEIPKESSAKMEVATDEAFTPIKQDTKKGNLRYYP